MHISILGHAKASYSCSAESAIDAEIYAEEFEVKDPSGSCESVSSQSTTCTNEASQICTLT